MNKIKAFTRMHSHNYEQLRGHQPQPDAASRSNWGHVGGGGNDDGVVGRGVDRLTGSQERVLLDRTEDSILALRSSHSSPISSSAAAAAGSGSDPSGATVSPSLQNGGHSLKAPRGPLPSSAAFRRTCSSIASSPAVLAAATSAEEERRGGGGGGGGEVEKGSSLVRESSYDFWSDELEPEPERAGGWNKVDDGRIDEERCSSSSHRRTKSFEFGGGGGSSNEADPPSRLIREFLQKQSATGSTFLDLDMDMDELTAKGARPVRPGANGSGSGNGNGNGNGVAASARPNSSVRASPPGQLKETRMSQADQDSLSSSSFDSPSPTSRLRNPLPSAGVRRPGEVVVDMPQNHRTSDFSSSSEEVSPLHEAAPLSGVGIRSRKAIPQPPIALDRKNSSNGGGGGAGAGAGAGGEVDPTARSPPMAYNKPPGFNRLKSRLVDVPKPPEMKAGDGKDEGRRSGGMSGALRSGLLGKLKRVDEEDDDPLKDADLPEKYRTRDKGFWTIAQWVSFLLILGGLATILAFRNLREMKRGGLMLWKWALLVMVVFSGRLVSGWIIWFFVIIIERNFLLRKRVLYFVYALRKGVQNCLWLGFALLAWHLMIDPKVDKDIAVVKYVTKILQCFLIGALIILVKTLIVKVFASSFHVSNFFERIQEALFNQYIMETLSGPPMLEIEQNHEEEMKFNEEIAILKEAGATGPNLPKMNDLPPLPPRRSGIIGASQMLNKSGGVPGGTKSGMIGMIGKPGEKKSQKLEEEGISVEHLTKLDQRNVSAWNMKRLVNIIRHSSLTHSIEETAYADAGVETEIQSEWQAKKAAKQIFKNVARKGAK